MEINLRTTNPLRVFVASSVEKLPIARLVATKLKSKLLATQLWDQGVFGFSSTYIEALEDELERADFAVVIFTADDSANIRKKMVNLPRDNVIFELGLFIGRLGRQRCVFLIEGGSRTQVPSDLSGVNPMTFNIKKSTEAGVKEALDVPIKQLREQITQLGVRYKPSRQARTNQEHLWRFSERLVGHWWERMRCGEDDKSALSFVEVTVDGVTNTPRLSGLAFGLNGELLAKWRSVTAAVLLQEQPAIHYRWEGEHDNEHGQVYDGGGVIHFDDERLTTGSGYFYTTNLALIREGARVKRFGLYRCEAQDTKIMARHWESEAKKLVLERLSSLPGR